MRLLEVKNLKKIYTTRFGGNQVQALSNVSFSVEQGEYVAIMGESGSGKTTLLNILASLDKPTSGEVFLDGKNIVTIKDSEISAFRRDNLGFVFQDFNLLDTLTLEENIGLALSLNHADPHSVQQRVRAIAEELEIGEILDKFPYQVSGGQKQRAACARAMVAGQSLLLADEPTGALDSKASKNLLEIMTRLNRVLGATILMVTHDPYSASYASRVLFLKDGRLFNELLRGERDRPAFYHEILDVLALVPVTEGVLAASEASEGAEAFIARAQQIPVEVNPRYGAWALDTLAVNQAGGQLSQPWPSATAPA